MHCIHSQYSSLLKYEGSSVNQLPFICLHLCSWKDSLYEALHRIFLHFGCLRLNFLLFVKQNQCKCFEWAASMIHRVFYTFVPNYTAEGSTCPFFVGSAKRGDIFTVKAKSALDKLHSEISRYPNQVGGYTTRVSANFISTTSVQFTLIDNQLWISFQL